MSTLPFRPLKTFPALGGRWGRQLQKISPRSEGDTSPGPADPIPTTPPQEVPGDLRSLAPPPHPRCPGVSQAAGPGKAGTGAPGRQHLALTPSTRSGAALATRSRPSGEGPAPRGPAGRFPCISAPPLSRTPASLAEAPAPPARPAGPGSSPSVPHRTPLLRPPVPAAAAALAAAAGPGDGAGPPRFPHPVPRPGPPRHGPPRGGPHFRDRPGSGAGPALRSPIG